MPLILYPDSCAKSRLLSQSLLESKLQYLCQQFGITKQHIVDSSLLKVYNSTGVEFVINDNLHRVFFFNGK